MLQAICSESFISSLSISECSKVFLRVFQSIFQSFPKYFSESTFQNIPTISLVYFSFSQFAFLNPLEAICPESSFSRLISRVLVFCTVPATRLDILALDSSLIQLIAKDILKEHIFYDTFFEVSKNKCGFGSLGEIS